MTRKSQSRFLIVDNKNILCLKAFGLMCGDERHLQIRSSAVNNCNRIGLTIISAIKRPAPAQQIRIIGISANKKHCASLWKIFQPNCHKLDCSFFCITVNIPQCKTIIIVFPYDRFFNLERILHHKCTADFNQ